VHYVGPCITPGGRLHYGRPLDRADFSFGAVSSPLIRASQPRFRDIPVVRLVAKTWRRVSSDTAQSG
jgi:hypothetical protein